MSHNQDEVQPDNPVNDLEYPMQPDLLSRRSFIKMIGAAAAGVVAATIPIPPPIAAAAAAQKDILDNVQLIASESPLLIRARNDLAQQGFIFDLQQVQGLLRDAKYPDIVGASLQESQSQNERAGANILLTVDLQSRAIPLLQYVVGNSLPNGLETRTVWMGSDNVRYEQQDVYSRLGIPLTRRPAIYPIKGVETSSRTLKKDINNPDYCPPDYWKECTGWYYNHCVEYTLCYCCFLTCSPATQCYRVSEYRNCRDCQDNPDCTTTCGSWYSEWREVCRGCSYYPGCNGASC